MSKYLQPQWHRSALVTIDVQQDFSLPGAPVEIPGTMEVIPWIAGLLDVYRSAGYPIIHIVRLYVADGSNADLCRRQQIEDGAQIVCPDTAGSQLVEDLLPESKISLDSALLLQGGIQHIGPGEVAIYKPRWGAFFKTPLQDYLGTLDVNTLIICGCNFPNCPRTTVYEASERDYRIVLADDAVSGLDEQGRQQMQNIGVQLLSTTDIMEVVKSQREK
ncbi:MAG: isochorismatase family cysteine hydrolase [Gammaproteobacteria bacterium]